MKLFLFLIISVIVITQSYGISVTCGPSDDDCYIDTGNNFTLDNDFSKLLSQDQINGINSILNNSTLSNRNKRVELNYFINKIVPSNTIKEYGKVLSQKISEEVEETLRNSGIYEPCFPFCNITDLIFTNFRK
uniref:Exported protein n=1 Tax=Strongyloides papillosus TaxID=174720 RepID=A0A0N5BJ70_STREA